MFFNPSAHVTLIPRPWIQELDPKDHQLVNGAGCTQKNQSDGPREATESLGCHSNGKPKERLKWETEPRRASSWFAGLYSDVQLEV